MHIMKDLLKKKGRKIRKIGRKNYVIDETIDLPHLHFRIKLKKDKKVGKVCENKLKEKIIDKKNLSTKQLKLLAHFLHNNFAPQDIYHSRDGLYENTSYLKRLGFLKTERNKKDGRKLEYYLTPSACFVIIYGEMDKFRHMFTMNFVRDSHEWILTQHNNIFMAIEKV